MRFKSHTNIISSFIRLKVVGALAIFILLTQMAVGQEIIKDTDPKLDESQVAENKEPTLDEKSPKEIRQLAKGAYRLGDTYTALFFFIAWAELKPTNFVLKFRVAELYRATRDYANAATWYSEIAEEYPKAFPHASFYLARMQLCLGQYEEAKANFLVFKKVGKKIKDRKFKKLTKSGILGCDYVMSFEDSIPSVIITHLDTSINHPHIEFSPIPVDSTTLYYGSLNVKKVNYYGVKRNDSIKIPMRKLYVARKEGKKWISKGEMEGPFNQDEASVGGAVLSENGNRMYFTICEKNWQNKVICELFYANKDSSGNGWQEPIRMNDEINMKGFTTTQPAIGRESKKNREVIYFVSDREGGKGGLDIWYTEFKKRKGIYTTPKNAGSKINTVGTEMTPYYDLETHKMYFSSDGHGSFGGLDVFGVEGEKTRWGIPIIVSQPVNSTADDIGFVLNKEKDGGFFVSNREGGVALLHPTCCDDIYSFKYPDHIDIDLYGNVQDSSGCIGDYEISIFINQKGTDEKYLSKKIVADDCDFKVPLEQGFKYTVEISKNGYLNDRRDISTKHILKSGDVHQAFYLEKIPDEPIILKGILYEFNSANLTDSAKTSIDTSLYEILIHNPDIIIMISSHTDSKGSDRYNLKLSEQRAESVIDYLVSKKIDPRRLQHQGLGETMPIAPNEHEDGSDNPAGRRLNRRTALEIIGRINPEEEDEP